MTYFVLVSFSSGDAVALLRESYTFVKRHSKVSCSYLIELMLLLLNVLHHLVSIRKNRCQFVNITLANILKRTTLSFISLAYLDLPQVDLFFIPDLFITLERSEKVISSVEVARSSAKETKASKELLERTFRKSSAYQMY